MVSLNKVLLIGNLTRDPELRYIPSGMAVADLGIAVNRRFRAQSGEFKEETCFVDVIAWGKQAEFCAEYFKKGRPIFIEGRLQLDQWEGKNGEKRSKLRVVADRIQFVDSRAASEGRMTTRGTERADEQVPPPPDPTEPLPDVPPAEEMPF